VLDTVANLSAMQADMFVVRHAASGAPYLIARHVAPDIHVINAGDGRHSHPTQGLLDMYTIRHYKKDFSNLRVAIVGDVLHSRVARSQIHALATLGCPEIRVIGPKTLLPAHVEQLGVHVYHDMRQGLKDVDVVTMLRLQSERMQGALLPSAQEFYKFYGLTGDKLAAAKPDAIVLHPGPMNRGVEIDSSVAMYSKPGSRSRAARSTSPGQTTRPVASITRFAPKPLGGSPMATILPAAM